ncbi:MAG TPA: hypothetical protein EYP29_01730 [Thermoplasmata archaeon]|nr:hypothetical protein [Thermoplasmata archaeon]
MSERLILRREEKQHLLEILTKYSLKLMGYSPSEIEKFYRYVSSLNLWEIYRSIILSSFLLEKEEELSSRELPFLYKENGEVKSEERRKDFSSEEISLSEKAEAKVMLVILDDLKRHVITHLMLISKDSISTLFHERKEFLEAHVSGERKAELWSEIGEGLSKEIMKKCHRYPPPGFHVRKVGRGWLFVRIGEWERMSLYELFLELSIPHLLARKENLYREIAELQKLVEEKKRENRRLLEKKNEMEETIRRLKKEKLEIWRKLSALEKSNKKMRKRLRTLKDEDGYEHMYL